MEINLINMYTKENCIAQIKELSCDHVDEFLKLQSSIVDNLPDKDTLYSLSSTKFLSVVTKYRCLPWGLFVDDILCGVWIMTAYKDSVHNLAHDVGFTGEELEKSCDFEIALLDSKFRGQRLDSRICKSISEKMKALGYLHSFATVDPSNIPSMAGLFSSGFYIVKRYSKYTGLDRYLFMKNFTTPFIFDKTTSIRVNILNVDIIEEKLNQGYMGTKIISQENSTLMQLELVI